MKRKIMVVDDERLVADTLGIIFQRRGFECRVSYTGAEAVAFSQDFCPELLLCDISMPGMGGLEAVSHITRNCPDCRVLLLTGHYTNLRSARKWVQTHANVSRILTKPVLPTQLLEQADELLHL